ncbi:AAA domain family protein [Rhodococcus sp. MTM3W5.2]|nr:AAA domain family protein [Rhodococcus sp. MTM3W5.2]
MTAATQATTARAGAVLAEVERAVVGKRDAITTVLLVVLAGGHVLIEDLPGLGKTLIARSFASALGLEFTRVQFTPDLLPADLLGSTVYDMQSGRFEFRAGPVFTNVLLADEINRTPPKTQAALLESMAEGQVSIDGVTRPLPDPFIVLATDNPIEYEGTYPLPEAQLDRFMLRLRVGYLGAADEQEMLQRRLDRGAATVAVRAIVTAEELHAMRGSVEQVSVHPDVLRYVVSLAAATRSHPQVEVGASPRAELDLVQLARARALLGGRDYVIPRTSRRWPRPRWHTGSRCDRRCGYAGSTRRRWSPTSCAGCRCRGRARERHRVAGLARGGGSCDVLGHRAGRRARRRQAGAAGLRRPDARRARGARAVAAPRRSRDRARRANDGPVVRGRVGAAGGRGGRGRLAIGARCPCTSAGRAGDRQGSGELGRPAHGRADHRRAVGELSAAGGRRRDRGGRVAGGCGGGRGCHGRCVPPCGSEPAGDPADGPARSVRGASHRTARARGGVRGHPRLRPRRPTASGELAGERTPSCPARHRTSDGPSGGCRGADRRAPAGSRAREREPGSVGTRWLSGRTGGASAW